MCYVFFSNIIVCNVAYLTVYWTGNAKGACLVIKVRGVVGRYILQVPILFNILRLSAFMYKSNGKVHQVLYTARILFDNPFFNKHLFHPGCEPLHIFWSVLYTVVTFLYKLPPYISYSYNSSTIKTTVCQELLFRRNIVHCV